MRRSGEQGETLVELMVTIMVLGIAVVAIVGAIGSSIIASDAHQNMASSEVVIRDYAEAVKKQGAATTVLCPGIPDLTPSFSRAGWTTTIVDVKYWIRDQPSYAGHYGDQAECQSRLAPPYCQVAVPACDPGLRLVTIRAVNNRTEYAARTTDTVIEVRRGNP